MPKNCTTFSLLGMLLGFLLTTSTAFGQFSDYQLAQHYYNMGELDKAVTYFEKIYKTDQSDAIFRQYLDCLTQTNNLKEQERLLRKQASIASNPEYSIQLGMFYEQQNESNKADKIYKGLIDQITANPNQVIHLYNAFRKFGKNDQSFHTITKGRSILKDSYPLHFQFADYYGATGQTKKMIREYLTLLDVNVAYKSSIQNYLSRLVDFTDTQSETYNLLKDELLSRVNTNSSEMTNTEMITWFFIQSRNFGMALTQEIALDKRMSLNGARVYELGSIASDNKDYTTAKKAFQYIINQGESNRYYHNAEMDLLSTQFSEISNNRNIGTSEIENTLQQYKSALTRLGKSNKTLRLQLQLAHIQAYYNGSANEAKQILEDALTLERLTDMQKAEVKMALGDIHVLQGDIWSASLLYMQVDKTFKNEPIGHEARFKNAKIFYYDGEFNFAQSQLDVLKQGTSRLISNDAIELSILITDNFGLDSNFTAMFRFAQADLLIEQRKYQQAFQLFDSIMTEFPYHSLGDEILIKKAYAMELQGLWNEAIAYYDELLKYYREDILADDAVYRKGIIYMDQLNELQKAQECFKSVLIDYKGSLHTTDARKRFRQLRGDTNVED